MTDQTVLGERLTESTEKLYRQVHPSWVVEGRVTSQAMLPSPKDEGFLSVSRGSMVSAAEAHAHHTERLKLASERVVSVQVSQVDSVGVAAYAQPIESPVPNTAHAVIDFNPLGKTDRKRAATQLAREARTEYAATGT